MKTILTFTLIGCPYCRSAQTAYAALHQKTEYLDVSIDWGDDDDTIYRMVEMALQEALA